MSYYFGIYGFEITRPILTEHFSLLPRFTAFAEAQGMAADGTKFHLTAVGMVNDQPDDEALFNLTAALTFCQQRWVAASQVVSLPDAVEASEVMGQFPALMSIAPGRGSHGEAIGSDTFYPEARSKFLNLCMGKLADTTFNDATGFRPAFFRHVESWRLYNPFVDLTYYLDFSALEILARTPQNNRRGSIAYLAAGLLKKHGFDVKVNDTTDRRRGIQTYAHLRNALFHNGEWVASFEENKVPVTLKLSDYEDKLRRLVPDLLLRVLGYEDDHINWDRWLDCMPWK